MAVKTRSAGSGDLRSRARLDFDLQSETISGQHASGDVMQVYQQSAIFLRECAHDLPGCNLAMGSHLALLEAQTQLMNSRVSSDWCRMEDNSGSGLKQATS